MCELPCLSCLTICSFLLEEVSLLYCCCLRLGSHTPCIQYILVKIVNTWMVPEAISWVLTINITLSTLWPLGHLILNITLGKLLFWTLIHIEGEWELDLKNMQIHPVEDGKVRFQTKVGLTSKPICYPQMYIKILKSIFHSFFQYLYLYFIFLVAKQYLYLFIFQYL